MTTPQQLRVGLVGAGGVGARHAVTIAGLDDVRLVSVTDVDPDRAEALAREHDATAVRDLEALLRTPGLDAVWLCLPPFVHGDPELAVIAAGLPFFVEKPLSVDLATAERVGAAVADAVASRGLVTATGYHWRCAPGVERAAQELAGTPVVLAHGAWWDKVPPVPWWLHREMSGGQLIEQATHLVDTMRVLVGEPVSVHTEAARVPGRDPGLVDVATSAVIRFDTGAVATLSATSVLVRKQAASLTLLAEGVVVEIGETGTVLTRGDRVERIPEDGLAKVRVDAEFCEAVRRADPTAVRAPYAEAVATHRVGCALALSASTGAPVQLGPVGVSTVHPDV